MEWMIPIALCMLAGIALVVLEVFLPGIGIPGVLGSVMFLGGIVLAWFKCSTNAALWITVAGAVLLFVSVLLALRSAAKGKLSRSAVILRDPQADNAPKTDWASYVGKTGVAETVLRPVGVAVLDGGERVNVIAEGAMIDKDQRVRVERVEDNHLFVVKE